jgi:phosphoadenosine phosphosulfate reductase
MESNKLPYHPLKYQGYESVGDAHSSRPLTKEDQENGNERAGRFHGVSQECGLHIDMDANKFMEELVVTTNPEQTNELFISKHLTEKIVIYSKPTCKYCLTAKQVFKENNWDFTEFTVGTDITIQALQQIVGKDVKTVPQIFMEGEYIGGYTDLCAKLDIPSRFA